MIGIVGGVGPHAGLDLVKKIFDLTNASRDQDYLPICLLSMPSIIEDRTEFLLGKGNVNPAVPISDIILKLEKAGSKYIGIPCNTAHSPQIFNEIIRGLKLNNSTVTLVNMIAEVCEYIKLTFPNIRRVGVLTTYGAYKVSLYQNYLELNGLEAIVPSENFQLNVVHDAIYNREYGIKAQSICITAKARAKLVEGIYYLQEKGAEVIVLGCTEIPLAINQTDSLVPLVDATIVLARSLVKKENPGRLKDTVDSMLVHKL